MIDLLTPEQREKVEEHRQLLEIRSKWGTNPTANNITSDLLAIIDTVAPNPSDEQVAKR